MKERFGKIIVCSCLLLLVVQTSFAQPHGLAFASNEVMQDKRTGIDLSPAKQLKFTHNFELQFDISIVPNKVEYFGYIVRLIENSKKNIDLIYDNSPNHFKIVAGERPPEIAFNTGRVNRGEWHTIKLQFDAVNKQLTVAEGTQKFTQKVDLEHNGNYKILFGESRFENFQNTDVPPMQIRDIRISEASNLRYHWPLNEDEGEIAVEVINHANASVSHPRWIRKLHRDWQPLKTFTLPGAISCAFHNGTVYLAGYDSVFAYNTTNGSSRSFKHASGKLNLLRGNQMIYDSLYNKLRIIYPDQNLVTSFSFQTNSWDKNFISPAEITDNWHFNKFISPVDSSLYVVAGYGHFIYKRGVKKIDFSTGAWDSLAVTGDFFTPRFLAALGVSGDGAYVVGGYGSQSGQQILNPRNIYDLLYYDRKNRSFRKIYDLALTGEDYVFANSIIINEQERAFYGLITPNRKFNSSLQLVKGSLDSPVVKKLGNAIPINFHDIHSFADLYFCSETSSFIAVSTYYNDDDQTEIRIYSLGYPALEAVPELLIAKPNSRLPIVIAVAAILAAAAGFLVLRTRKGKPIPVSPVIPEAKPTAPEPTLSLPATKFAEAQHTKSSVFLFGDLQLYDAEGQDITKSLTPLLKELFLVILMYTVRKERGISSEKLKEILWFDKTAESARNNRSVNIAKLKSILDRISHVEVSKETAYWKINFDPVNVHLDYYECLAIINEKGNLDKDRIEHLARITKRGNLLTNVDYDWLEPFKSEISNMVIDTYLHYAATIPISHDPEFLIRIASYITDFDSVNEEAMILKCKALVHLGKHSLAKHSFENFNREYKLLYGEEFSKGFQEILDH